MTKDPFRKVALILFFIYSGYSYSVTFTSVVDGDWTTPSTWGKSGSGTPGTDYPSTGDDIVIESHVSYDIGSLIIYGKVSVNSGSFTFPTGASAFETIGNMTLNAPLIMNGNTLFILKGNFDSSPSGLINMVDQTSIFEISDNAGFVNINGNMTIAKGLLIIKANGVNKITLGSTANITMEANSAIYLKGSNGQFDVDGSLVVKEYAEMVSNFNANMTIDQATNDGILFEFGSSFYRTKNVNKITFTGSFVPTHEIKFTDSGVGKWRHISSAFETPFAWSDLIGTDMEASIVSGQYNTFWWDADGGGVGNQAPGWQAVTANSEGFVSGGKCFTIYNGGTNFPFSNQGLIQIRKPTYYQETFGYTLYNSVDPGTSVPVSEGDQGWNLLGNPYPAWLNLDDFLTNDMSGNYQGAHIWDSQNGNYVAYLANGETLESTHDISGPFVTTTANKFIRPFQGFWVKMSKSSGASTSVNITESDRSLNPILNAPSYFKTNNTLSRLRLNTYSQSDSAWDQVLIAINPAATDHFDLSKDGLDRVGLVSNPNMYISCSGEKLCIDSRPIDQIETIPLHFENGQNGETYFLSMVKNQFDPSMAAYLEDIKTGILYDLEMDDIQFKHDNNFSKHRFNIYLAPYEIDKNEILNESLKIKAWVSNSELHIAINEEFIGTNANIEFWDLSGRIISSNKLRITDRNSSIALPAHKGLMLIKITHHSLDSIIIKCI